MRPIIEQLQKEMKKEKIHMLLIPTGDPHMSEYVGDHDQLRAYLSGFTGSAGTLLVTQQEALLWTDGRYFIQARQQLEHSGIQLMCQGEPEVPSVENYIKEHYKTEDILAYDGKTMSAHEALKLQKLTGCKVDDKLQTALDGIIGRIWKDRPQRNKGPIEELTLFYTGRRTKEKLERIRQEMRKVHAQTLILSELDQIAWLLNLRGRDIPCNPVFYSYVIITAKTCVLFANKKSISDHLLERLEDQQIQIFEYAQLEAKLSSVVKGKTIWLDPYGTNAWLYYKLAKDHNICKKPSPVKQLKAVKTTAECENIREAQVDDSAAFIKFLYCLKTKEEITTEMDVVSYLSQIRSNIRDYRGDSFDTIAAYGANGAMCHYSPSAEKPIKLEKEGFLLVDTGGQYLRGTTDLTRTIAIGPLTKEQKECYTLVLKGHIALAQAVFPQGVSGAGLDVLARGPLWQQKLDFRHGTGHGVGYYLNVHESPVNIGWDYRKNPDRGLPLEPGMLTSNEPGYYQEGDYGIRLENLMLVQKAGDPSSYGQFLCFETVTMVPFEREAIEKDLLTQSELAWINEYHQQVLEKTSSKLTKEERMWLQTQTAPL